MAHSQTGVNKATSLWTKWRNLTEQPDILCLKWTHYWSRVIKCEYYSFPGRKFVTILMRFWYLTNARLPEDTLEGTRVFQVAIGGEGEAETKRLLSANYEWAYHFCLEGLFILNIRKRCVNLGIDTDRSFLIWQIPKGVHEGCASRLDHYQDRALQAFGLKWFWLSGSCATGN